MIRVNSVHRLEEMEPALCRVCPKHGAHVLAVTALGSLLGADTRCNAQDALSFTICHRELYAALLAADIRFATFLPCRIAAIRDGSGVMLETVSPRQFCRSMGRADLDRLVSPLETVLRELMTDAAQLEALRAEHVGTADSSLGARENQMSMRAPIPQRIDCHGTKIEDLAGTGELDSPGG